MACFYGNTYQNKPPFIHKRLFQRLSDKFHQDAFSTLLDTRSKLRTYGLLKNEIGREIYLKQISNPIIRKSYTKFRLSNHHLMIETGRHKCIKKKLRFCPICPKEIENELHFLLECQAFKTIRDELITKVVREVRDFSQLAKPDKFVTLVNNPTILSLTANYIHRAFDIKQYLLNKHKNPI